MEIDDLLSWVATPGARPPKQESKNIFEAKLPSLDFLARHSFSNGGFYLPEL
jgi:hypothetical protein